MKELSWNLRAITEGLFTSCSGCVPLFDFAYLHHPCSYSPSGCLWPQRQYIQHQRKIWSKVRTPMFQAYLESGNWKSTEILPFVPAIAQHKFASPSLHLYTHWLASFCIWPWNWPSNSPVGWYTKLFAQCPDPFFCALAFQFLSQCYKSQNRAQITTAQSQAVFWTFSPKLQHSKEVI
jgi:hypothetical protein